jgi:hypothetical protein
MAEHAWYFEALLLGQHDRGYDPVLSQRDNLTDFSNETKWQELLEIKLPKLDARSEVLPSITASLPRYHPFRAVPPTDISDKPCTQYSRRPLVQDVIRRCKRACRGLHRNKPDLVTPSQWFPKPWRNTIIQGKRIAIRARPSIAIRNHVGLPFHYERPLR